MLKKPEVKNKEKWNKSLCICSCDIGEIYKLIKKYKYIKYPQLLELMLSNYSAF